MLHGLVSYSRAGGIDRPLVITKGGTSVVPHQNWRGQFARGTFASGTRAGESSDCATYPPSNGCLPISWPGWATTAWHDDAGKQPTTGYEHYWFGSQAVGMRDASGQMYMRNRYYDPATGQFTQPDPIGLAGGLNSYGFAAGDPVSFSDPYGLLPIKFRVDDPARERLQQMFARAWHNSPTFRRAARAMIQDKYSNHIIVSSGSGSADCYAQSCTKSLWNETGVRGATRSTIASVGSDGPIGDDEFESFVHEFVHAAGMNGARSRSFAARSGIPGGCMRQEAGDNDGSCVENYETRILAETRASEQQSRSTPGTGAAND